MGIENFLPSKKIKIGSLESDSKIKSSEMSNIQKIDSINVNKGELSEQGREQKIESLRWHIEKNSKAVEYDRLSTKKISPTFEKNLLAREKDIENWKKELTELGIEDVDVIVDSKINFETERKLIDLKNKNAVENINENQESKESFLKNKLGKVKNYLMMLVAVGYIGQGITGYNNAGEEFNPKNMEEFAKGIAKAGLIYPVIETMEDIDDFMYEASIKNGFVPKDIEVKEGYDINEAISSGKTAMEIAEENVKQIEEGDTVSEIDFRKLKVYTLARAISREYNLDSTYYF